MAWAGSRAAEAEYKAALAAAKGPKKPQKPKRIKKPKRDWTTEEWAMLQYGQRNGLLKKLGIGPTYADYLASPLWAGIRRRVMARDKGLCQICAKKADSVHHQRYRKGNLLGLTLSHMFAICRECHELIEFDQDGKKLSPRAAACQAFDLAKKHGKGLLKERKKAKKLTNAERLERKKLKIRERQEANLRRKNRAKRLEIERQERSKESPPAEIIQPKTVGSNVPTTAWTGPTIKRS